MTIPSLTSQFKNDPERTLHVAGTPILKTRELCVHYDSGPALENISFELNTGERIAVVGPNGAGKSTLFKAVAGVIKPSRGEISIFGADPGGHVCIAYIPQRSQVDWNFPVTVSEVVMMGRTRRVGLFRWPDSEDKRIVKHALSIVGLSQLSGRQINQLSGGQQQRMFIARALAQESELLLMDEPVTGLDTPSQEELFSVLDSLKQNGVTVMLALHDLKLAADRFDRVMLLNHQLIAIGPPSEIFREEILRKAYGNHIQIFAGERDLNVFEDSCCGDEEEGHA